MNTSRTATYRIIAVVSGLALGLLMIATTSRAVWIDTTANSGNSVATGSVVLTDDDGGTALLTVTNASPGQTWTRCIDVIYQGTVGANVRMTNITVTGDAGLASELNATFAVAATSNCSTASGVGSRSLGTYTPAGGGDPALGEAWAVTAAGQHRSYQITVTFNSAAANTTQNKNVGFAITWTATSN